MTPEERAGRVLIAAAAVTALLLAAYFYGAGAGRPRPLPAASPAFRHSVAFRLHLNGEAHQ
jgi:hypothetical protein